MGYVVYLQEELRLPLNLGQRYPERARLEVRPGEDYPGELQEGEV